MARPHPKTGKPMKSGKGVEAAHREIRKRIMRLREDRVLSDDIASSVVMLEEGSMMREVGKSVGGLK